MSPHSVTDSSVLRMARAPESSSITIGNARFTVLTSRLIRLEYSPDTQFTDAATQIVINRDFPTPKFTVSEGPDRLDILTEHLSITYIPSLGFTSAGLTVSLRQAALNPHGSTWHWGDTWDPEENFATNLGGTTRTLDEVDGRTQVEPGLLSRTGISTLDDSNSLLLRSDGQAPGVLPRRDGETGTRGVKHHAETRENRKEEHDVGTKQEHNVDQKDKRVLGHSEYHDVYVFGYGLDYMQALRDFFTLTGPTPLIPRALLGTWWSRYHPYSADEYRALMDRFDSEDIPISVAVLDMDWHLVDIDPSLGTGWTGYTWNRELFPDPPAFLTELHERGMQVALNVHPASGIRAHEECFENVCEAMGINPDSTTAIPCDLTNPDFVRAYLEQVHHPLEDQGVDLWWLDWQQGTHTTMTGLDPLWALNEIHFKDSGRNDRRQVTFSRYADPSSHRTPIGFSGDTYATWESLDFQSEFTAMAANIGYYWWSHDVGGHMFGRRDDAMAARWVQLGCFSPITRLHSTLSEFNSKEPWRYGRQAHDVMAQFLRFRHRMVPSIYTWSRRCHEEGVGLVRPVYHDHPAQLPAYEWPNTVMFGDLLVVPFTHPLDPESGLGRECVWLPGGQWWDLATSRQYSSPSADARVPGSGAAFGVNQGDGRSIEMFRPLEQIGVLAKAGQILVLASDLHEAAGENPRALTVLLVPGEEGSVSEFVLAEDDGGPDGSAAVFTTLRAYWGSDKVRLDWRGEGADGVVPENRDLTIEVLGHMPGDVLIDSLANIDDSDSKASTDANEGLGRAQHSTDTHQSAQAFRTPSDSNDFVMAAQATVTRIDGDGYVLGARGRVEFGSVSMLPGEGGSIILSGLTSCAPKPLEHIHDILERAQIDYLLKDRIWATCTKGLSPLETIADLRTMDIQPDLLGAIVEVLG
ncbi:glycoside hydrolase family 31 protein [Actinomyces vulturis]|uniref:glycoside hydrolase family 31 protein n=1 Tax=Actinomyces vulturis TaxID=1857645 RepID=UPI00082DB456|nr:glycoside hydrolase family 31 protein [Actinomyces vulturis]